MDITTPLELILNCWIHGKCSLYTLLIMDPDDPNNNIGEAFLYLREDVSKKLLLPLFTSEFMAERFIRDYPLENAKIILVTRKKFNILAKRHKVAGIVAEPSYDPPYAHPIFLDGSTK